MNTIQSVRITKTEGTSDKEYRIHLVELEGGFQINSQNGRRGGTLTSQKPKPLEPTTRIEAEKLFNDLLKSKLRDGYVMDGETTAYQQVIPKEKKSTIIQLLKDVKDETEAKRLLADSNYAVEEKFDGRRRTLDKNKESVSGGNKKCEAVPLPMSVVESVSGYQDIELDGELVGEHLFVFDILRLNGEDLKTKSFKERKDILKSLKFGSSLTIIKTEYTSEGKKALLEEISQRGGEGAVFKKIDAPYTAGRDSSTAYKYKLYKTATILVSAITKGKRSVKMTMRDGATLTEVGAVTIPVNQNIPQVGDFCEVRYLYAYKGGSLFQPTFICTRDDVDETDIELTQLSYKAE